MNRFRKIKIEKGHYIIALLLLIIFSLTTYYLVTLLPEKKRKDQEINKLRVEVTRLQSQKYEKETQLDDRKVFSDCDQEAEKNARELLAKKIELGKVSGGYDVQAYQKAYDLGLRLKDDYNSYYENCLR